MDQNRYWTVLAFAPKVVKDALIVLHEGSLKVDGVCQTIYEWRHGQRRSNAFLTNLGVTGLFNRAPHSSILRGVRKSTSTRRVVETKNHGDRCFDVSTHVWHEHLEVVGLLHHKPGVP